MAKGTNIDGDVSIGRNVHTGGSASVAGTLEVGHNVRVKGWLDAPNIKGSDKGMFADEQSLLSAYPLPKKGDRAYVGSVLPADIYLVKDGKWYNTHNKGGDPSIDLHPYVAKEELCQEPGEDPHVPMSQQAVSHVLSSHQQIMDGLQRDVTAQGNQIEEVNLSSEAFIISAVTENTKPLMKYPELLSFDENTTAEQFKAFFVKYPFATLFDLASTGKKRLLALGDDHYNSLGAMHLATQSQYIELRAIDTNETKGMFPSKTLALQWVQNNQTNTLKLQENGGKYSARKIVVMRNKELLEKVDSDIQRIETTTNQTLDALNVEIADFKSAMTTQVNDYKPTVINGSVTNAADEEDLTSVKLPEGSTVLQLKGRSPLNGMGYKILRKGGNFANQIKGLENYIFEIRYEFDLGGTDELHKVTVPSNCVLKFIGGKLRNGIVVGQDTQILSPKKRIFDDIILDGTFTNEWPVEWFGANIARTDNQIPINYAIEQVHEIMGGGKVVLSSRYNISDTVYIKPKVSLVGISRNSNYRTAEGKEANCALIATFQEYKKWIVDIKMDDGKTFPYNEFVMDYKPDARTCGIILSNFSIHAENKIWGSVRLRGIFNSKIENIDSEGTYYGLLVSVAWSNTFSNLRFLAHYNGLFLSKWCTINTFINVTSNRNRHPEYNDFVPNYIHKDKILPVFMNEKDVDNIAIISDGYGSADTNHNTFYSCNFEGFEITLLSYWSASYLYNTYLECKTKKLIVWAYDGFVKMVDYVGGYSNKDNELNCYEFATIKGHIYAENFHLSRCFDNVAYLESIKEQLAKKYNYAYEIRSTDFTAHYPCYWDKITLNEEGFPVGEKTQSKVINTNMDLFYIEKPAKYTTEVYMVGITNIGVGNSFWNPITFDELLKRTTQNRLECVICNYGNEGFNTEEIINNRELVIRNSGIVGVYPGNIKLSIPLNVKNSILTFDNVSWNQEGQNAAFNISGNVVINESGNYLVLSKTKSFHFFGDEPIKLIINNAPQWDYYENIRKVEDMVDNAAEWGKPYDITINMSNSKIKHFTNVPTEGASSERPTNIVSDGFRFFDKTIVPNRFIWKHGTKWIDANGTEV